MKQTLLELFRQKKGSLIIVGILLLSNIILITLINGYQESALNEAKRKWTDLRNRVAAVERGDVSAAYQQGKRDLEKLETMLPPKRQFPRLLGDILDAAASSGLAMGPYSGALLANATLGKPTELALRPFLPLVQS